jgi:hypothetical protein
MNSSVRFISVRRKEKFATVIMRCIKQFYNLVSCSCDRRIRSFSNRVPLEILLILELYYCFI